MEEAKKLADAGKSAAEIKELLEAIQWDSDIYITVDTLKYLKKGGRLTPAAAAIGTVLNLKPVLRLKGEKLDAFAKSRGWKSAKKTMIKTINEIRTSEFGDCDGKKDLYLDAAYTGDRKEAQEWLDELHEAFPEFEIRMESTVVECGMPYRTWSQGGDSYQNSSCELMRKRLFAQHGVSAFVQKASFLTNGEGLNNLQLLLVFICKRCAKFLGNYGFIQV